MVSLLADRKQAQFYPFSIDCDAGDEGEAASPNTDSNDFYRMAQTSAALAHALLMVSARHLLITSDGSGLLVEDAISHKDRALQLLKGEIEGLPNRNLREVLATITLLAACEVGASPVVRTVRAFELTKIFPSSWSARTTSGRSIW